MLRDEGEAYSRKLREAGVDVSATRYEGTIHDFVMLNALRDTNAAQAAIDQATSYLRDALTNDHRRQKAGRWPPPVIDPLLVAGVGHESVPPARRARATTRSSGRGLGVA